MLRDLTHDDYPTLCQWWDFYKFPRPPYEILPQTGFMSREAAAGFLYITNSPISWLEFVVSDPKADKKLRNEAIDMLISSMKRKAAVVDSTVMFTSATNLAFISRLKKHGFTLGDLKATQLVCKI